MDADAVADLRARIKSDVGKQVHVLAELRIVADGISGLQNGTRADGHAFADDAMRPDVRGRVNFCGRRDDGGRMDSCGEFLLGEKQRDGLGGSDAGIGHADDDFLRG